MENLNEELINEEKDVTIRQDNMTILDLDGDEGDVLISGILASETVTTPVFINITHITDENFYGDIQICERYHELASKKYYVVDITAVSLDDNVIFVDAVKIGIREMLNKFKSDKVNIDSIYLLHALDVPSYNMIQMGLAIQEILIMNKLSKKVRLWIENLDTRVCEEEVCSITVKSCNEKDKKKKKKDKDKKKKKKGKKK